MVGTEMALAAHFWLSGLRKRKLVTQVAFIAIADAPVFVRLADRMAALACGGGYVSTFNVEERIARRGRDSIWCARDLGYALCQLPLRGIDIM